MAEPEGPVRLDYDDIPEKIRSEIYYRMYMNHMGINYMAEQLEIVMQKEIENAKELVRRIVEEGEEGNIENLGPLFRIKKPEPEEPTVPVLPPSEAPGRGLRFPRYHSAIEVFDAIRTLVEQGTLPREEIPKLVEWLKSYVE